MELSTLEKSFKSNQFHTEDDIKIHFHSDIIKPLLEELNPSMATQYRSEDRLLAGGRTDATFQNISFELKKHRYFHSSSGINEALHGRNERDHGLYEYIISNSGIKKSDSSTDMRFKLLNSIGVGFDGETFLFARFVPTPLSHKLDTHKLNFDFDIDLPVQFDWETSANFSSGLKKLAFLLKQQDKIALNKKNLIDKINPKSDFVRKNIKLIYDALQFNLTSLDGSSRVRTLYKEWDRVFGTMYGEDEDATTFTEVSSAIRESYGYDSAVAIDSKAYLFALQTFFNMFLKLLIYSFLAQLISPTFKTEELSKIQVNKLFDGELNKYESLVNNFFETHFMEWFTFTCNDSFDVEVVNDIFKVINQFDLSTYILKPEELQDILQEVYMSLIPSEMRHLMGEYFSPDWIVEHALDLAGYTGDIDKTLIDPTAGSGSFLTHAIKRVIHTTGHKLSRDDIEKITHNIIGFDINPISVVSAKANYILAIFSSCDDSVFEDYADPVNIPIYIADSILAPIVYSEESQTYLTINTSVGKFRIPKFSNYEKASKFLNALSKSIDDKCDFDIFWSQIESRLVDASSKSIVENLFNQLYIFHRAEKDSFWPVILRNSFAPILIGDKFDFVVGNPPWIAWKSMSKSYRDGTLEIWKSYGIFEKSAYDKKTTHDDFGMAVTYVAVDQYLKDSGSMVFLLPASFLKSTKGGEGFRKFSITRHGQSVPFSVDSVDDFSDVKLFTIPTIALKLTKGKETQYPLKAYKVWHQPGRKAVIDSHAKWDEVEKLLSSELLSAQPVDQNDRQSAWLTLPDMEFANNVLDTSKPRYYTGRKGIEPAGAKGVYLLKKPIRCRDGLMLIENCIERQRRPDFLRKGIHKEKIEETYIYPMLGGRNIAKWRVKSNEYILLPHTAQYKYGIPVRELARTAPKTSDWLNFYHDELLASRIQNGKFFNASTQPYYRLDNVGEYTYAPYKVLWKEQTGSMSAVVVSSYLESVPDADQNLFREDKVIVVDSKVLMLGLNNPEEAYYVCGIVNAPVITEIIDGYAISTNRGVDVLKYLAIPKFDANNPLHQKIANFSKEVHVLCKTNEHFDTAPLEKQLSAIVQELFL